MESPNFENDSIATETTRKRHMCLTCQVQQEAKATNQDKKMKNLKRLVKLKAANSQLIRHLCRSSTRKN